MGYHTEEVQPMAGQALGETSRWVQRQAFSRVDAHGNNVQVSLPREWVHRQTRQTAVLYMLKKKQQEWDFPGGLGVKNLPCNAGSMGLVPGQETDPTYRGTTKPLCGNY